MSTVLVVVIFFMLSLLGAVVLFKFLKSWAKIENKIGQAGGAIAGFLLIYYFLYTSYCYISIERVKLKQFELKQIEGTIIPYRENIKLVLAVKEVVPDSKGKFRLRASSSCIDPEKNDIALYIITEDKYYHYNIYYEEEMRGIEISIPTKE